MKICIDQNLSRHIRELLPAHEVRHAKELGWDRLTNGELLAAAEAADFDVLLTADQNIPWQNRMDGRRIAVLILSLNRWPTIEREAHSLMAALEEIAPGECRSLTFPRPRRARWPPPERRGPG